ncbi:hypothetical protein VdG1_02893 [Verticillium dahliae VDG1]|nr:hypothetical protein VdG1_02893 [Verticillium dahliae VDG1]
MFTGIVEDLGTVTELNTQDATGGTSLTITLAPDSQLLSDAHLGDSIAVNGVCLTVTSFTPTAFTIGVAPETLRITNLGALTTGSRVNLERAVRADTRMGGHFVQGHVDTTATIAARWWEVMLISYTQEKVVTAAKKPGETVNVEVDMMAKYAEKSLAAYFGQAGAAAAGTTIKDIAAQNQ